MDYILKQLEPGNPHPLLICLHENEMTIGRSTITSLSKYNRVSRSHASITKRDGCWFITDLESLNFLYVNLQRVQHSVQLNIGDIIGFGSPNVSVTPDGGFVCVLTTRNRTVKQEPLDDDDDCIEVPIYNEATASSSRVNEDPMNLNHAKIERCKLNTGRLKPTLSVDPDAYKAEHVTDSIHANPSTTDGVNKTNRVNSSTGTIYDKVRSEEANSDTVRYNAGPDMNTNCSQMSAYPGIEYLDDLTSCGIIQSNDESLETRADVVDTNTNIDNSVPVANLGTKDSSLKVKQEIFSGDTASNLSKTYKLKTSVYSDSKLNLEKDKPSTINNYKDPNNLNEIPDQKPIMGFYFPKDSIPKPIDQIEKNYVSKLMTLENKIPETSSSGHSDGRHTFLKNTCEGNVVESNIGLKNLPNDIKKEKDLRDNYLNEMLPTYTTDFWKSLDIFNNKQNSDNAKIGRVSLLGNATQPKESQMNKELNDKNAKYMSETVRNCNVQLDKCNNTNLPLNEIFSCKRDNSELKYSNEISKRVETNSISQTHNKVDDSKISEALKINVKKNKCLISKLDSNISYVSANIRNISQYEIPSNTNKSEIEQFGESLSQNLHRCAITDTSILKTLSSKKVFTVKNRNFSNGYVGNNIKQKTERQQKELIGSGEAIEDDVNSPPSVSIKRKSDTKYPHVSKRWKTRETKNDEINSDVMNLFTNPNTMESKDKSTVSNGRSKKQYAQKNYLDKLSSTLSDNNDECIKITSEGLQKNLSKSVGRTLLIKPMEYKPRTRRGREEFKEQTESNHKKYNKDAHETVISINKKGVEKRKSNTETLKNIGLATTGSRKQNAKYCNKKIGKETKLKRQRKYEAQPPEIRVEKNLNKNDADNAYESRRPPTPRRKDSISSRMTFLNGPPSNSKNTYDKDEQKKFMLANDKNLSLSTQQILSSRKLFEKEVPSKMEEHRYSAKHDSTHTPTKSIIDSLNITLNQHAFNGNQNQICMEDKLRNHKFSFDLDYRSLNNTEQKETLDRHWNMSEVPNSHLTKPILKKEITSSKSVYSKKVAMVSPINKLVNDQDKIDEKPIGHTIANVGQCFHACSTTLVEMIVSWNPKWLQEQNNNKKPPPLITKDASCLNICFPSLESYTSSYFPMILLEVWECLFKESKNFMFIEQLQNWNNFCYTIKSWTDRRKLTELRCESLVSDVLGYQPTKGKVVLLNIKNKAEHKIENYVFGCIRRHSIEEFKRDSPEWDNMPTDVLNNAKLVKFELLIKKLKTPLQIKHVHLAHGIVNIKDKMQLADALRSFRDSPLCKDIYHPHKESFKFCDSNRQLPSRTNLVKSLFEEVINCKSDTKVLLLHAPSGTGKTKFAAELVEKLIVENPKKSKVLVCTPSYSTLDEILYRLVEKSACYNSWPSTDSFKVVRLGEDEKVSSQLKEYTLLSKVAKLYGEDCAKKMRSRESELKLLEGRINELLFKQSTDHSKYRKINKDSVLQALTEKLGSLKQKNLLHPMDEGYRKGYECIVLKETDVLLSTLENSMLPSARTFLKDEENAYCIVDEAAQCSELELLQCLHHPEISKLILIGDSQQFPPTVNSKYAIKCGFGRSTVERFCLYYRKKYHMSLPPSFMKQHRMHSEIYRFPSGYFYNQEMITAEDTDERFASFPLKPYIVIDILDQGVIPEETESSLILYICSLLLQAAPGASIGVIVDRKEKCGLMTCDYDFEDVEISTLKGLQGREKDIVLVPCVQPFFPSNEFLSCGKKLNVAITRAKQCLIICGRVSSLVQYSHWRALLDDAMSRNCYLCVASVKHIPLVFGNYIKKV